MQYYIAVGSELKGPYSLEELKTMDIKVDTFIWHEGLTDWAEAKTIPVLNEFFTKSIIPEIPQKEFAPSNIIENDLLKMKWYNKPLWVYVLCFLFFPVGFYLLWTNPRINKTAKYLITFIAGCFFIGLINRNVNSNVNSNYSNNFTKSSNAKESDFDALVGRYLADGNSNAGFDISYNEYSTNLLNRYNVYCFGPTYSENLTGGSMSGGDSEGSILQLYNQNGHQELLLTYYPKLHELLYSGSSGFKVFKKVSQ